MTFTELFVLIIVYILTSNLWIIEELLDYIQDYLAVRELRRLFANLEETLFSGN